MVLASLGPEAQERGVLAAIRSGRNVKEGLLSLNIDGDALIKPHHANTFIDWLADQLQAYAAEGNHVIHNLTPNTANIVWSSTHRSRFFLTLHPGHRRQTICTQQHRPCHGTALGRHQHDVRVAQGLRRL